MDNREFKISIKEKMIRILDSILAKKIHPLEGIRELLVLRHQVNMSNDELFIPLVGIASETDEFPIGNVRNHFDKSRLEKLDQELDEYLKKSASNIEKSCSLLKNKIELLTF